MNNVEYSRYSRNYMYFLFKLPLCHCHRDMNRMIQLGHEVAPFVLTLCFSDCLRFNINFPILYIPIVIMPICIIIFLSLNALRRYKI